MLADYLLSGKKWAGPREGVSIAGYGAWALGFVVGILPFLPVSDSLKTAAQPAVVYSLITGFVVYIVLAKMGLQPAVVKEPVAVATKA
jgi:cytosine permease